MPLDEITSFRGPKKAPVKSAKRGSNLRLPQERRWAFHKNAHDLRTWGIKIARDLRVAFCENSQGFNSAPVLASVMVNFSW